MTGYGGHQPQLEDEVELPKIIVAPVVGYTGTYRGKNVGKLGRCEVHKTRLSAWEKDTVSGILGVPAPADDWEFSHYTNTCSNFSEKKFHETKSNSLPGSPSVCPSSSGMYGASFGNSDSPQQLRREATETDKILESIQICLETRFKTATVARSALKSAFFAADAQRTGLLHRDAFFETLRRLAGVHLPPSQSDHLCAALHAAGHSHSGKLSGGLPEGHFAVGARLEEEDEQQLQDSLALSEEEAPQEVNYGRFLNILVPRSSRPAGASSPSPKKM
jgi:hypothetical protein